MTRFGKIRMDAKVLRTYRQRLEQERKVYHQVIGATSETGRKNRALAAGECVLKGIECVEELACRNPKIPFIDGSLYWTIDQQRIRDEDGEKGFRYLVSYTVTSNEPAWTKDEIREKVADARERLRNETREMFGTIGTRMMERFLRKNLDPEDMEAPEDATEDAG